MIIQLLQRSEKKLSNHFLSEVEAMLLKENKKLFTEISKVIWLIFALLVLTKLLFPGIIPLKLIFCFFILLGLFTIGFVFNLHLLSAVIGALAITSVFSYQLLAFPLNSELTLIEGSFVLIIGSLVFYNRFIFVFWSVLSLFYYIFGTIFIKWDEKSPIGIADINFLCIWLVVVGICWLFLKKTVELFDRFKTAKNALVIDPLTSVYNRAYLQDRIEKIEKKVGSNNALTILAIDLDFFKNINDTYGHPLGDRVLIHFADTMKRNLRPKDTIIRYGGEEFLVLMWHDGKLNIHECSNRLCHNIRENPYNLEGGESIHISCSVGAATYNSVAETIHECIERADTALYKAKNSGRDRVEIDMGM